MSCRLGLHVAPSPASLAACILVLAVSGSSEAQPSGRNVPCRVEAGGKVVVTGTCRFLGEQGGSFVLTHVDNKKPLIAGDRDAPGVLDISVTIVAPGRAEVRGLTTNGNNSRWGAASRSKRDSACWEGSDFRVCAY